MRKQNDQILFEAQDFAFLDRFGIEEATRMVLDFKTLHPTLPFLFDTLQLASFLRMTRKDLFSLVKTCDEKYRTVTLKKKNGKTRVLHAPSDALKRTQKIILQNFLSMLPVSPYATAYVKKRSLSDNASPHVGKRYLLKLDITDFFGSISFYHVYRTAFHTGYFPKQIGVMLCTLCCRNDVLPQGAPTSPALSNLVLRNFDDNIGWWCKQRGITYTRYCDDITFSSDKPLFPVYEKVRTMLDEMGLLLNEKKTHFVTHAARQSVTGLTVNEKVAVSGDYKRKLRQEVHYALKYGVRNSFTHVKTECADAYQYCLSLMGRIAFVLQIEPENVWFRNALEQLRPQEAECYDAL